jgi:hypothetical protein
LLAATHGSTQGTGGRGESSVLLDVCGRTNVQVIPSRQLKWQYSCEIYVRRKTVELHTFAHLLILAGAIVSVVSGIHIMFLAFGESLLWGLAYLFLPPVGLIFIFLHWSDTKGPALRGLLAAVVINFGSILLQ